jgi:adenosine deaminase
MFDTDIIAEYEKAQSEFGLVDAELIRIARTGFEAAFLNDTDRLKLLKEFDSKVQALRANQK